MCNMAEMGVVCLACGSKISKATERRNICNSSSELIVSLWKRYLKRELEQRNQLSVYEAAFTELSEVRMTHKRTSAENNLDGLEHLWDAKNSLTGLL